MRIHVLVAAGALLVAGGIAGCARTTPGTVAMTTEPGFSTSTSSPRTSLPGTPRTPRTSTPRTSSNVPPPGDSLTLTCKEYNALDPDAQRAVIGEILAQEDSVLGPANSDIAKTLADAVCEFFPQGTVSEVLLGGTPP